jgi:hypothetical protein
LEEKEKHRKTYEEIIKKRKTLNVRSVRFINLGIPRSGKTTFWRRMMKQISGITENEEPSTGVADEQKPVLIRSFGVVMPDEWYALDRSGYASMLLQMFPQVLRSNLSLDTLSLGNDIPATSPSSMADALSSLDTASDSVDAHPSSGVFPTGLSEPFVNIEATFSSLFEKAIESGGNFVQCTLDNMILLSCADTGGHAEFLDMQAALINGPSFNLFFSRLTDSLSNLFPVHFTHENSESTPKKDSDSTVKEVMFQALSSITCFGNFHFSSERTPSEGASSTEVQEVMKSHQSKIMFVGTFKDEVSDEEFEKKDAELQREVAGTAFYKNILFADHDKKQLMLKVDNKNGGITEVEQVRKIMKEKIEKCFQRIPIPASWFVLTLQINDHKSPTMTLGDCEKLAEGLNISPDELQSALWFLHHGLGVLLYYPVGKLKDTVFCKIHAVYSGITNLIKKTYTARHVQHESSLDEFEKLGIFSLQEIQNVPDSSNSISRDLLIRLLEHLYIITPAPPALSPTGIESPYFMPCKLKCSRERVEIPSSGNSEPLKLRFKCGFTPVGVFPAMITKLVNESGWTILPEQDRIFKNRVRFRVGRDIIFMMSHLKYFEMAIVQKPCSSATKVCYNVREVIEDTLKKVTVSMNYNFLGGHDCAFWCSECVSGERHLAVVKEATLPSAFVECCRDKAVTGDLNPRHKVWFSKEGECK